MRTFNNSDLEREISDYAVHTELITYSTLLAVNQGVNVVNLSPPGIGKSRSTVELLRYLNIDVNIVSGHITPKAFFDIISENKPIVIDESANI